MTWPAAAAARRPVGARAGARELADPPALEAGETAFDSPVPDARFYGGSWRRAWRVRLAVGHQALNLEARVRLPYSLLMPSGCPR